MSPAILLIVWFAVFAMTVQLGLWSNTILLAQIVLAGLVAFGFYQPLATVMDEASDGSYTYFMDFLALWALYCGAMLILKVLDGALSKKRMRFQERVEQFGGPLMGLVAGWAMAGVVVATLHAAPLRPETLPIKKGDVATASRLTSPDLLWLDVVEAASEAGVLGSGESPFSTQKYVARYADRRQKFSEQKKSTVRRSTAGARRAALPGGAKTGSRDG